MGSDDSVSARGPVFGPTRAGGIGPWHTGDAVVDIPSGGPPALAGGRRAGASGVRREAGSFYRHGRGTTVKMKIPLTLAIIPALTATSGGDRYASPQVSLLELVRLEGEQAQRGIERIHGAPVHRLRGNLLPLVYLHRELQVESARGADNGEINIVVLQADDRQFGLVVDAIHDTEEIVVKPLQKQIKGISTFAGATIMGDGKVALILDVLGLAQRANVVSAVRERALTEKAAAAAEAAADRQTVLLFATEDGGRNGHPPGDGGPPGGVPALGRRARRAAPRWRSSASPVPRSATSSRSSPRSPSRPTCWL